MALSNLHTNWINGSYIADRDAEIKSWKILTWQTVF